MKNRNTILTTVLLILAGFALPTALHAQIVKLAVGGEHLGNIDVATEERQ